MGRQRIQIKYIENKSNRKATFRKRRAGLEKKVHELAVLCNAEIQLYVLNDDGSCSSYISNRDKEKKAKELAEKQLKEKCKKEQKKLQLQQQSEDAKRIEAMCMQAAPELQAPPASSSGLEQCLQAEPAQQDQFLELQAVEQPLVQFFDPLPQPPELQVFHDQQGFIFDVDPQAFAQQQPQQGELLFDQQFYPMDQYLLADPQQCLLGYSQQQQYLVSVSDYFSQQQQQQYQVNGSGYFSQDHQYQLNGPQQQYPVNDFSQHLVNGPDSFSQHPVNGFGQPLINGPDNFGQQQQYPVNGSDNFGQQQQYLVNGPDNFSQPINGPDNYSQPISVPDNYSQQQQQYPVNGLDNYSPQQQYPVNGSDNYSPQQQYPVIGPVYYSQQQFPVNSFNQPQQQEKYPASYSGDYYENQQEQSKAASPTKNMFGGALSPRVFPVDSCVQPVDDGIDFEALVDEVLSKKC